MSDYEAEAAPSPGQARFEELQALQDAKGVAAEGAQALYDTDRDHGEHSVLDRYRASSGSTIWRWALGGLSRVSD